MTVQVKITGGYHRGELVSGTFPLVKEYTEGAMGGYITVSVPTGTSWAKTPSPRIKLTRGDFELVGESVAVTSTVHNQLLTPVTNFETVFTNNETDEEAMERMSETFNMLDLLTDACSKGTIRGLVVSGPPGIGKSFGVERTLEEANMFRTIAAKDPLYEIISGGVSPIGLYQKLYYNRGPEHVTVFDDSDGVLFDEECITLLKAALNSGDRRKICWNKESRVLGNEDIPSSFDFEGSVIFLSNVDFERSISKASRISAHLAAIMSRCHYLDLEISSMRDRLLRIKQIVNAGMLNSFNLSKEQEMDIVTFIMDNSEYLREVSLRMVKKVADIVKTDPKGWYALAEATTLSKDAKFKRLYEKKQREAELNGVVLV